MTTLAAPTQLGRYELIRRVGVGGMAEVYEAALRGAEGFSRRLALKLLLPEAREDPAVVDMFIDEATIVARLQHPNVVDVYEFGQIDGTYFMAMEYVDGWTLRQLQRRLAAPGGLPVPAAAYCALQVCQALDYIHGAEIVHRDVTPQNIFVDRHGRVKLGDFGIAKAEARRSRTVSGQIKGKLAYLAPEQVSDEQVTEQTDVYAAGLVLFELLTGRPLIDGPREVDLIRVALAPPVIAPSSLRPAAAPLDRCVGRALERHPAVRYATAALMASDLQGYLDGAGGLPAGRAALQAALPESSGGDPVSPPAIATVRGPLPARAPSPAAAVAPVAGGTVALAPAAERLAADPPAGADEPPVRARSGRWLLLGAGLTVAGAAALALVLLRSSPAGRPAAAGIDGGPVDRALIDAGEDAAAGAEAGDAAVNTASPVKAGGARPRRRRPPGRRVSRSRTPRSKAVASPRKADPAAARGASERERWRARVDRALAGARARGVYPGDDATLDRLARVARRQPTTTAAAAVERRAAAVRVDRAFAERKLGRVSRAIARAGLPEARRQQLSRRSQRVLQLIISGAHAEASRRMSRLLAELR